MNENHETSGGGRRAIIVLSTIVCLLFGAATLVRLTPPPGVLFDFVQEWASARNHYHDQPVYSPLTKTIPLYFGTDWKAVTIDINAHPPASVFMLLPLSQFEYRQAHQIWNICSLIALAASVWILIGKYGLRLPAWTALPILALILSSHSFTQQMIQGQLNLILMLLFMLAWSTHRSGRSMQSGFWMGVAAAIKLFPAYMGLYYLVRRDWRAVVSMGFSFFLINGLAIWVLGVSTYEDYFTRVVPAVKDGFRDFWANASISGFWSKLLDAPNGHVITALHSPMLATVLTLVCAMIVTALAGWKCWKAKSLAERDLAFATCTIAMMLVSPITWDHYFLLLVLTWCILWHYLPATIFNRFVTGLTLFVLFMVRFGWVVNSVVPGPGELVYFGNETPSVALPIHAITVLSYQFYSLIALLIFAWFAKPREEISATRETSGLDRVPEPVASH